ncbi:MAG: hypothetical protein Q9191_006800 [Dirinaria sp. TL-2023a]
MRRATAVSLSRTLSVSTIGLITQPRLDATTTTIKNASYVTSWQIGVDNVGTYNTAKGPYTTTSMINATATSIYGTVVTSPAGFYVIPSVKVIHAPAVTQANGQLACTTSSSWSLLCPDESVTSTQVSTVRASAVISGMNSAVQNYFSGQQGPSVITVATTILETESHVATNSSAYPSTTVISFSTPFLHFPPEAATESVDDPEVQIYPVTIPGAAKTSTTFSFVTPAPVTPVPIPTTTYSTLTHVDNVEYGFLPPDIIPWLLKQPDYVAQYPNLGSCVIGGPSIGIADGCTYAAAATAGIVPDLTTGSAVTVKGLGCFHPGSCPAAATGSAEPAALPAAQAAKSAPATSSPNTEPSVAALPEQSNAQPQPSVNPLSAIAPIPIAQSSEVPPPASSPSPKAAAPSGSPKKPVNTGAKENSPPKASGNANSAAAVVPEQASSQAAKSQGASPAGASAEQPNPISKPSPAPNSPVSSEQASPLDQKPPSPSPSPPSSTGFGAIIVGAFGSHAEPIPSIASNVASQVVIGSQTLAPGSSPIVVSGSTYSLAPSASAVVVNGHTSPLAAPHPAPVITIASQPVTANAASQFIVNGQTLAAGSPAITVSGSTYSLEPSASAVVVNGHTTPLAAPQPAPVITINSQPITASAGTQFIVNGQTLAAGSPAITISGSTYSLAPSASAIIINGHTSPLNLASPQSVNTPNAEQLFTVASHLVTARPLSGGSEYVVGGSQTLVPGGSAVTISGVPVSLPSSGGSEVIVAGSTEALVAPTGSGGVNNGNYSGPGFVAAGNSLLRGKRRQRLSGVVMVALTVAMMVPVGFLPLL